VLQHSVAAPNECQARLLSLQNLMHVKSRYPASQKVPREDYWEAGFHKILIYLAKYGLNFRNALFNFQWLVRTVAPSLFRAFTYRSRRRLFIDQLFFEQSRFGAVARVVVSQARIAA
jgi:hypothetical protein